MGKSSAVVPPSQPRTQVFVAQPQQYVQPPQANNPAPFNMAHAPTVPPQQYQANSSPNYQANAQSNYQANAPSNYQANAPSNYQQNHPQQNFGNSPQYGNSAPAPCNTQEQPFHEYAAPAPTQTIFEVPQVSVPPQAYMGSNAHNLY